MQRRVARRSCRDERYCLNGSQVFVGHYTSSPRIDTTLACGLQIATSKSEIHLDYSQIAKDTHGFVGADLSQLCMEAALRCIREQMHTIDVDADRIPVVSREGETRCQVCVMFNF